MLKAIKLPTSISNLNAGLTNVDRNALSHFLSREIRRSKWKGEGLMKGFRDARLLRRFSGCFVATIEGVVFA